MIPIIQNEPIVDPNCALGQPLRPARKRPGSRSRGAYEARVAPHEISGPKSARPHGGIPSPGTEQRRGQWVGSGQGGIYVVKKGHARDIYFLLQTRSFWHFSAPSSLFPSRYLLASAFHRLYWLLSHGASIWSFCRSKEFVLV
jgi:hypothetical protein